MTRRLRVGISPCPNDTFAFHALLERRIPTPGLELAFELDDVEALNRRFQAGELDASKVSFASLAARDDVRILAAGAALGFGVGPLLLARRAQSWGLGPSGRPRLPAAARVLCPGQGTTASLLLRLFHAGEGEVEQVLFSRVIPALAAGEADFGVCIHEGRFTYAAHGLVLVEDLGQVWEQRSGCALPLGGIAARAGLAPDACAELETAIRASIDYAHAHRDEALATMRRHAAEQSDAVLWQHVELYVNAWTRDLGESGRAALARFFALARQSP